MKYVSFGQVSMNNTYSVSSLSPSLKLHQVYKGDIKKQIKLHNMQLKLIYYTKSLYDWS